LGRETENGIIGIIAASHCMLAQEMIAAAEIIVGPLPHCKAVCFKPDQTVDELIKLMKDAIKEVDQGSGVLILTDLFGGTPANIGLSFQGPRVEVICGMNLPMLIKLAGCRKGYSLNEAASLVKEYGQRHISLAGQVLSRSAK
jgi:PTS system mannose-specific IIA component